MTQTTILAAGTTAATSTDITLAAGAVATVGVFTDNASSTIGYGGYFSIMQDTPGEDIFVGLLNGQQRSVQISGPGVFRVKRPVLEFSFGVFLES